MSMAKNLAVLLAVTFVNSNCADNKFAGSNASAPAKTPTKPTIEVATDGSLDAGGGGANTTLPPADFGKWYQATSTQICSADCSAKGLKSIPVPGTKIFCMSGEKRPASGVAAGIVFSYGAWRDASPTPESSFEIEGGLASEGKNCYSVTQKRDNDKTDITVGCYCGP